MQTAFEAFYVSVVECVADLIELDPAPDSPEGKLLTGLASAIEEYEKQVYKIGANDT